MYICLFRKKKELHPVLLLPEQLLSLLAYYTSGERGRITNSVRNITKQLLLHLEGSLNLSVPWQYSVKLYWNWSAHGIDRGASSWSPPDLDMFRLQAKQLKSGHFQCKEEFLMTVLVLAASDSLSWGYKSFSYQSSLAINHQCLELVPVDGTLAIHEVNIIVFAKNLHQLASFLPKQVLRSEHRKKKILSSGQK